MEMHQIRYFLAVARTLNFTRAAEECNVAQPSLTRAIHKLEDELGGQLFRRERASSHLTNLGRAMLPLLERSFDSALAARAQAESFRRGEAGAIRVALSHTVDLGLVSEALRELERVFAEIQLTCQRVTGCEVVELLRAGDAEVALAGPIEESWERVEHWPLFVESHRVVVHPGHALAGRERVKVHDLSGQRIIMRGYCELWPQCRMMLEASGVDLGRCHEVSSDRDAVSLLESGLGVGLLPVSTPIGENLCALTLDHRLDRTLNLYLVTGRQRSPALNSFVNLLRAADWSRFEGAPA